MTTFCEVNLTCAVCGHADRHTVLLSTSMFGATDLDTRPPPPARMALAMQVQCCPACGYCAEDISQALPGARAVVTRQEYQAQLHDDRFPYLANMFLCQSMIEEAVSNYVAAGMAALRAAWACDDGEVNYEAAAIECRLRAVAQLMKAQEQGHSFIAEPGAEQALLADLLRRSRRFTEAEAMVTRGLRLCSDESTRRILLFQRHLSHLKDSDVHTVREAMEWIEPGR